MSVPSLATAHAYLQPSDPARADMNTLYAARWLRLLRELGLPETTGVREVLAEMREREQAAHAPLFAVIDACDRLSGGGR